MKVIYIQTMKKKEQYYTMKNFINDIKLNIFYYYYYFKNKYKK